MSVALNDERLQLVPSKYANYMIAYKPSADEDAYYIFRKTKTMTLHDGTKSESYRCRGCERSKGEGFVSTTIMKNGRLVRDPDQEHRAGCVPLTKIELEALKLRREMTKRCRDGDDPRAAYEMVMAESVTIFEADEEAQRLLQEKIGSFLSQRPSLLRNASRNKSEEYAQLTTRERRRLAAITAAKKRRALRLAAQQYQCVSDGTTMQDGHDEASAAVQWLKSNTSLVARPSTQRQPNTPAVITVAVDGHHLVRQSGARSSSDNIFLPEHDYNMVRYNAAERARETLNVSNGTNTPTANNSLKRPRLNVRQPAPPLSIRPLPSDHTQYSTAIGSASITDIVKVMEACRKKSRWESFGEYMAKTLEALPEEAACKAAKEMQEILFRAKGISNF